MQVIEAKIHYFPPFRFLSYFHAKLGTWWPGTGYTAPFAVAWNPWNFIPEILVEWKAHKEFNNHWLFFTLLGQILKDEISSLVKSNRFSISLSTSGSPRTKQTAGIYISESREPWFLGSQDCYPCLVAEPVWDFKRSWRTFEENFSSEVKRVMIVAV